jgi:hypothetical protein
MYPILIQLGRDVEKPFITKTAHNRLKMSGERPEKTEEEKRSYTALHRALQALMLAMKSQLKTPTSGETSFETLI